MLPSRSDSLETPLRGYDDPAGRSSPTRRRDLGELVFESPSDHRRADELVQTTRITIANG
jgi:hypothetical protein